MHIVYFIFYTYCDLCLDLFPFKIHLAINAIVMGDNVIGRNPCFRVHL
jgi:hypothetical protein